MLYNSAGHFILLMSFKKMIRTEMKSLLKKGWEAEETETLKIPKNELLKSDYQRIDEREFTFCGKLYDIISERASGDTLIIHCIHDVREQRVKEQVAAHISSQLSHENSPFKKQQRASQLALKNIIKEISFFKKPVFVCNYTTLFLKGPEFLQPLSHISEQPIPPPKV
jgi:hypothetical protein